MKTIYVTLLSFLICLKSFSQIEGDVRNSEDKPIVRAVIVAMDTTKKVIDSVISAENGFYSFNKLKPGIYLIEAKAVGFESRLYKNIVARENFLDPDDGRDLSSATRLQIVLSPAKSKQ
jgi:Carboxypeptidase regulatory-like domain